MVPVYKCFFDGAIAKNPGGKMGWGAIILKNGEEVLCEFGGEKEDDSNSNNVAEYCGLELILDYLLKAEKGQIEIYGDSMMVIKQMIGRYRLHEDKLYYDKGIVCKEKMTKVRELHKFKQLKTNPYLSWIPREENTYADELSKRGLELNSSL